MMKNKKPLIGILVVVILIGSWLIWSFTHPEFCLTDADCRYDKWERTCVNKYNLLLGDLFDLINPYYYPPPPLPPESFYIEENIPCNCIDHKCVGDIEALCKRACEDWKVNDCTSKPYATSEAEDRGIRAREVFFQMNCGKKINCECLEKQEITITTDKTEYEQEEVVKIKITNGLSHPIIYAKRPECGSPFWSLEKFEKGDWKKAYYYLPCAWEYPDYHYTRLDSAESLESKWDGKIYIDIQYRQYVSVPGRYRVSFSYVVPKLFESKNFGKLICENLPEELEKLLREGKWVKTGNESCTRKVKLSEGSYNLCEPPICGCGCTAKDVWSIDRAKIDIEYFYCNTNLDRYWIKYKNASYLCFPEYVKEYPLEFPTVKGVYPNLATVDRETVYSNEFTIREKQRVIATSLAEIVENAEKFNGMNVRVSGEIVTSLLKYSGIEGYPGGAILFAYLQDENSSVELEIENITREEFTEERAKFRKTHEGKKVTIEGLVQLEGGELLSIRVKNIEFIG